MLVQCIASYIVLVAALHAFKEPIPAPAAPVSTVGGMQETLPENTSFSVLYDHLDTTYLDENGQTQTTPVSGYRLYRSIAGQPLSTTPVLSVPFTNRVNGVVTFAVPAGWAPGDYVIDAGAWNTVGEARSTTYAVRVTGTAPPQDSTPFSGAPVPLPGTVQAENFDNGGEGIAYHDLTTANEGGAYRPSERVDLEPTTDTGTGFNVGWTGAGEWLVYTVDVAQAGTYDLEFRLASTVAGGTFRLESGSADLSGLVTWTNTGGWQNWVTVRKTGVALTAGVQKFKIFMVANNPSGYLGNINWFRVAPAAPPPVPVDCVVSDWAFQSATAWSACVNGQQTRTEIWTRTITTQPANGGAACPALSETRTGTQTCTAPPQSIILTPKTANCRIEAEDVLGPPTVQSGWGVQFRFNNPDGTFTNLGLRDVTNPYKQTSGQRAPGTYQVSDVWTRTGSPTVIRGPFSVPCQ